jgi:uncharacterized protein (DUF305 family)
MKIFKTLIGAGCAVIILAGPAQAQMAPSTPANREYMAAMEKMDKNMGEATDADPTKSFAKKMMAHHEGAIEMAQIVQKYTKDEQILKMTKKMIPAQQKEVKELKDWLAKH